MKIAIIGINGYLGRHIAEFYLKKGFIVEGYDIQNDCYNPSISYSSIDISKAVEFEKFNFDIDYCFYFSGLTGTSAGFSNYESFIDINEKGLMHYLHKCRTLNKKIHTIFPSTRLVYKGDKDKPLKEDAAKEFKTIYSLNKWFCECMLQQHYKSFQLPFTIFRICVPYGNLLANEYSYGTIGVFLNKAVKEKKISLFGDGLQKRTFSHVEDICLQIDGVINSKIENGIFNIDGETFSLYEIANLISAKFNADVQCNPWPLIDLSLESGDTIFDSSAIQAITKYKLKHNFIQWLQQV
jgi:UDP-glucose 4-epimerase